MAVDKSNLEKMTRFIGEGEKRGGGGRRRDGPATAQPQAAAAT